MLTVTYTAPHELHLVDAPKPVPGPGEVLVEVAALGICGSDLLLWEGGFARAGRRRSRIQRNHRRRRRIGCPEPG
jgi:threonine dehydrogenase-like Zn-dependent dehydrogenase